MQKYDLDQFIVVNKDESELKGSHQQMRSRNDKIV